MLRSTGSFSVRASSKTRRMPDSSIERIRSAIQLVCIVWLLVIVRRAELVGELVELALHLAHALRAIFRIELQALMNDVAQRLWRGRVALLHGLQRLGIGFGAD